MKKITKLQLSGIIFISTFLLPMIILVIRDMILNGSKL